MFNEIYEYRDKIARKLCQIEGRDFDELPESPSILFDEKTKSDYLWAADQILSLFPALAQRDKIARKLCELDKRNFNELFEVHSNLFDEKTKSDYLWAADQILILFPSLAEERKRVPTN